MGKPRQTITAAARRIEREFEEPLRDVIAGYAEMGYSRRLVAETLEVSFESLKHYNRRENIRFCRSPIEHREIKGRPPRMIRQNGREQSLGAWADELGLSKEGVRQRIRRTGRPTRGH